MTQSNEPPRPAAGLLKTPTGVRGLDDLTGGGLPAGRPTLVCGGPGCGKTLLSMEFLVHGAREYDEPGVFVSFEETAADLVANCASLGFDLAALVAQKLLVLDHVHLERSEVEEAGEYDLEGLFVRIGYAADSIGATRIVLDSVESLFGALPNESVLRAELRRLFRWLKARGLTAIVTGERGERTLTRHGIEEYVSDCVIVLDNRVAEQVSTRRLRIAKYRGSVHGANEYPFLVDGDGISVLPVTSLGLEHKASLERIPTGVPRLDTMLGGKGYYRGSSILVSGTAGSGKTSLAACFADETCRRGERCLTFLFEESPDQLLRNMTSIGLELAPRVRDGLLRLHASRPSFTGLEKHLAVMLREIETFDPHVVIIDPMSAFAAVSGQLEVKALWLRLVDAVKSRGATLMLVNLTPAGGPAERTDAAISSLIDTWILLRDVEQSGERSHSLYVLKSRGMAHSNQVRELLITDRGLELADVYLGPSEVLFGSARRTQEAGEETQRAARLTEVERRRAALERQREALEARVAALRAEFAALELQAVAELDRDEVRIQDAVDGRAVMSRSRQADADGGGAKAPR